jgi:hypothetical protein
MIRPRPPVGRLRFCRETSRRPGSHVYGVPRMTLRVAVPPRLLVTVTLVLGLKRKITDPPYYPPPRFGSIGMNWPVTVSVNVSTASLRLLVAWINRSPVGGTIAL